MSKQKILVFGYFGYETNQLDGQTIKTRNIYELLKLKSNECNYSLEYFDSQKLSKNKLSVFTLLLKLLRANKIYYLCAHKNLTLIFPVIFVLSFLLKKKILFVVVGGWLVEFIENKPIHRFMLKRITAIYPQTALMTSQLRERYGFNNVWQLHNFRIRNNLNAHREPIKTNQIKLVFMARVNPMKGVGTIFKLAKSLSKTDIKYQIDIYGPLLESYSDKFNKSLKNFSGKVNYLGALQPDNIQQTLAQYDLMLFPTQYFTEGFPGTVLDAYEAGLPVVATRWKYAEEYIEDDTSGIICDFENPDDFINKVIQLANNPDQILRLKVGAANKAKEYSPEAAWDILSVNLR